MVVAVEEDKDTSCTGMEMCFPASLVVDSETFVIMKEKLDIEEEDMPTHLSVWPRSGE